MLNTVSVKVFLSHIICNKKVVVVTVSNFLSEVEHEVRVYGCSVTSFHLF